MTELQLHVIGTLNDQTVFAMVDKETGEIRSISIYKGKTRVKDCHFDRLELKEKIIQNLLKEREAYGDMAFMDDIINHREEQKCEDQP
jgi:hypothetical protein